MNIYIVLGETNDERVIKSSIKFNDYYILAWDLNYKKASKSIHILSHKNGYSDVHLFCISSNNNNGHLIDFLQSNKIPRASDVVDGHHSGYKVYVEIGRKNYNLITDVLWEYLIIKKDLCPKDVEVKKEMFRGKEYFVVCFYKTDYNKAITDYKELAVLMYEMWRKKQ